MCELLFLGTQLLDSQKRVANIAILVLVVRSSKLILKIGSRKHIQRQFVSNQIQAIMNGVSGT